MASPRDRPRESPHDGSHFSDTHSPKPFTLNGDPGRNVLTETTSLPILNRDIDTLLHNHTMSQDDSRPPRGHVTFNVQPSESEEEEEARDGFEATKHYANVTLYGSDTELEDEDKADTCNNNNHSYHRRRQSSMGSSRRSRSSRRFSVMDFRRERSASKANPFDRRKSSVGLVCIEDVPEKDLEWLEGDGFLERLESEVEEIDADILQKGVNELRNDKPETCRSRMLDVLTGRAFTFVVLVVALLDAVAIITQIILDIQANHLHAKYMEQRDKHLVKLLVELDQQPFNEMNLTAVEDLVYLLSKKLGYTNATDKTTKTRRKRSLDGIYYDELPDNVLRLDTKDGLKNNDDDNNKKQEEVSLRNRLTNLHNEMLRKIARTTLLGSDVRWDFSDAESEILHRSKRAAGAEEVDKYPDLDLPYKSLKKDYTSLGKASHYLHYASIGLLAFLVFEVILKFIGFGLEFFQHKLEVTDAIVVTTSFVLDLVFINEHEKNIPVVIFLFIWQMIRVISALIMQNKKRVEFLLRVLGELNKTMSEQIDQLKDELEEEKKRSTGLYQLCGELGATDDVISNKLENPGKLLDDDSQGKKHLFTMSPIVGIKNMLHASKEALGIGRKATPNPSPAHKHKKKKDTKDSTSELVLSTLAFNNIYDPNLLGVTEHQFCNGGGPPKSRSSFTINSELDSKSDSTAENTDAEKDETKTETEKENGEDGKDMNESTVDSGIVNEAFVSEPDASDTTPVNVDDVTVYVDEKTDPADNVKC